MLFYVVFPFLFCNFEAEKSNNKMAEINTGEKIDSGKSISGAAVAFEHTYSAQELGEMMNTNPLALTKLNIGLQTRWYDCEYIEEVLRHVDKEPDIQMLMTLIVVKWRRDIDERNTQVSHYSPEARTWVPYVEDLPEKLQAVKARIDSYRQHKEEERRMMEQWQQAYSTPTQTAVSSFGSSTSSSPTCPTRDAEQSDVPSDDTPPKPEHRWSDFDKEQMRCLLLPDDDDELFSVYIKTMREDIWPFVSEKGNKNKYLNVVRFIGKLRGIYAEKMDMPTFDRHLQAVIPVVESQLSSLKQRKDCNDEKNLEKYLDPVKKKENKCWQLTQDGPKIEELFKPVTELMAKKKHE